MPVVPASSPMTCGCAFNAASDRRHDNDPRRAIASAARGVVAAASRCYARAGRRAAHACRSNPREVHRMLDARAALRAVGDVLRAAWRPPLGKVMTALLVLSLWVKWLVVLPLVYFGFRAGRTITRRLLYSVRAKLVAFYLFSALLPIVLVAVILVCIGYVVLGQTSARVVEARLDK